LPAKHANDTNRELCIRVILLSFCFCWKDWELRMARMKGGLIRVIDAPLAIPTCTSVRAPGCCRRAYA